MNQPTDSSLTFIRFARAITYLVYGFFILAVIFLSLGFVLLLFGANTSASFVKFVYHFAAFFLQPFRNIFPGHQLSERSYFSGAALFAIIMYGLGAMAIHSLITWLTVRQQIHLAELERIRKLQAQAAVQRPVQTRPVTTRKS